MEIAGFNTSSRPIIILKMLNASDHPHDLCLLPSAKIISNIPLSKKPTAKPIESMMYDSNMANFAIAFLPLEENQIPYL